MNRKALLTATFAVVLAMCLAAVYSPVSDAESEGPESVEEYAKYYYNQLDDVGKAVYNAMFDLEIDDGGKTATASIDIPYSGELTQEAVTAASGPIFESATEGISAFRLEQLWQYWFEGGASMNMSFDTDHFVFTVTVDVNDYYGSDYVKCNADIITAIKAVEIDTTTRESSVRAIHDYVIGLLTYTKNESLMNSSVVRSIYTSLVGSHDVVCEGYAKSLKVFCDYYEIPCVLVTGNATKFDSGVAVGTEAHMWALVQMDDGAWYLVDCTWDDQESPVYQHTYFLVGSESDGFYEGYKVATTHVTGLPDGLTAPDLSEKSFAEACSSGSSADGSTWIYSNKDYSITISSASGIVDSDAGTTGWEADAATLKTLVIAEGVKELRSLPSLPSLQSIVLPSTLTYVAPGILPGLSFFCGTVGNAVAIDVSADHLSGRTFTVTDTSAYAGHVLGKMNVAVAPSCTVAGSIAYADCSRCGSHVDAEGAIHADVSVSALGHAKIHHDAKASTCTAFGNIEYDTCSRCSKNFDTAGNEVSLIDVSLPKAPHTEKVLPYQEPGPGCPGKTEGKICEVCGTILVQQHTIPATDSSDSALDDLFGGENGSLVKGAIGAAIVAIIVLLGLAVVRMRRR